MRENNKDTVLQINPYVFLGLSSELKQRVRRTHTDRSSKLDVIYGHHKKFTDLSNATELLTGFSINDIRSKANVDLYSDVGIKEVRQVFCMIACEMINNYAVVGRFLGRGRSWMYYINNTVRENLNARSHEDLTTIYNKIKDKMIYE